jgi:hypothetical protein
VELHQLHRVLADAGSLGHQLLQGGAGRAAGGTESRGAAEQWGGQAGGGAACRRRCMHPPAPGGHPVAAGRTCIRGCLRKSLPSLMISTLERLALLLAGGRLGVATQVVTPCPALRELVLGAQGWRTRPPPVAKAQLADCMLPVASGSGAGWGCSSKAPDGWLTQAEYNNQRAVRRRVGPKSMFCQHGRPAHGKGLLFNGAFGLNAGPIVAIGGRTRWDSPRPHRVPVSGWQQNFAEARHAALPERLPA